MTTLPTDKIISCFYDSTDDCVKVIDRDGLLMSFNPQGLRIMEIDNPKEVIGTDWLSFWKGSIRQLAAEALETARGGKVAKFEGYCPTYKGTMKYWEVTIAPLFGDHGDLQWLLVNSRDATARKDLEAEVVELRAQIAELTVCAK